MRRFQWFAIASVVGGLLIPFEAFAKNFPIGNHTVGEVRRACGAAFAVAADGSGYGCRKDCKSGGKVVKDGCAVACDNNNKCQGQTPDKVVPPGPKTLTGVLRGFSGMAGVAGADAGPPRTPRTGTVMHQGLLEGGGGVLHTGGPATAGSPAAPAARAPAGPTIK